MNSNWWIIIYNGESDFLRCDTEDEVKKEIESLINNGYASDDIEVFKGQPVEFKIKIKDIQIEFEQPY